MIARAVPIATLLAFATGAFATAADGAAPEHTAPQLVAMPQILVPIVGSDHIEGSLRVKLVLAAKDPASLARLTERLPELREASVGGAIEFSRLFASAQSPVDARRLSADLTAVLRAEDPGIARVLIVEVFAQS